LISYSNEANQKWLVLLDIQRSLMAYYDFDRESSKVLGVVMRNGLKTLLFLSAISPVFLVLSYVRFDSSGLDAPVIQLLVIGLIGCIIPILIMMLAVRTGEKFSFEAKKIESNDFALIAFVVSYFVPVLLKAANLEFQFIIVIVLAVSVLLWVTTNIPAHPLLSIIMKYKFYKVESASGVVYSLVTRKKLLKPQDIKKVTKISDSMLLELT
jgi:hypothetical protein